MSELSKLDLKAVIQSQETLFCCNETRIGAPTAEIGRIKPQPLIPAGFPGPVLLVR